LPVVVLLTICAARGWWTAAFSSVFLLLCVAAAVPLLRSWRRRGESARDGAALFLIALAGLASAILLVNEVVYLRDTFGTRMNTVFKFYYHVWLLLGLVGGASLAVWLGRPARESAAPTRAGALGLTALAVALGAVYPLAATWTKSNGFRDQPSLDGAAFLERGRSADAAAIAWLRQQPEREVVLEAVGGDYQEFARVSTFSGRPTVIGWIGHELQWRGQLDEYNRRQQDVETLYRRGDQ